MVRYFYPRSKRTRVLFVHSQFVVGIDFARGQRFNPSSSYWVEVTEVGRGKTTSYWTGVGQGSACQRHDSELGKPSMSRQSALIIDQTNGMEQQLFLHTLILHLEDRFVNDG